MQRCVRRSEGTVGNGGGSLPRYLRAAVVRYEYARRARFARFVRFIM